MIYWGGLVVFATINALAVNLLDAPVQGAVSGAIVGVAYTFAYAMGKAGL